MTTLEIQNYLDYAFVLAVMLGIFTCIIFICYISGKYNVTFGTAYRFMNLARYLDRETDKIDKKELKKVNVAAAIIAFLFGIIFACRWYFR